MSLREKSDAVEDSEAWSDNIISEANNIRVINPVRELKDVILKKQMANKVVEEMMVKKGIAIVYKRIGKEQFKKILREIGYSKREVEKIVRNEKKHIDGDDVRFWENVYGKINRGDDRGNEL